MSTHHVRAWFFAAACAVVTWSCQQHHAGIPAPIPLFPSAGSAHGVLAIEVLNAGPHFHYEVEFDLGGNYIIRTPSLDEPSHDLVFSTIPSGVYSAVHPFTTGGMAKVRLIRRQGSESSSSAWFDFLIIIRDLPPPGQSGLVTIGVVNGTELLTRHGMGDALVLQGAANTNLGFEPLLLQDAQHVKALARVGQVVGDAMGGVTTTLGSMNGIQARFTSGSVLMTDRSFASFEGALADEFQSDPPQWDAFGTFTIACAHDLPPFVDRYRLIMAGAFQWNLGIIEAAFSASVHGSPTALSGDALGGLILSSTLFSACLGSFTLDCLSGESSQGGSGFTVFESVVPLLIPVVEQSGGMAEDHVTAFALFYGTVLHEAGMVFADTLSLFDPTLESLLAGAFNAQVIPANGVPAAGFSIEVSVNQSSSHYVVTAKTLDPATANVPLKLILTSSDGTFEVFNATANGAGIANFPTILVGSSDTLDVLLVVPATAPLPSNAQGSAVVVFN